MEIFFDILNHAAGYHPLNNFEEKQEELEDLVEVLLSIENIDAVVNCYESDPRPRAFLEHLILLNNTENYSRNHFPIILETSNSQLWCNDLYRDLNIGYHNFPAVDLYA